MGTNMNLFARIGFDKPYTPPSHVFGDLVLLALQDGKVIRRYDDKRLRRSV